MVVVWSRIPRLVGLADRITKFTSITGLTDFKSNTSFAHISTVFICRHVRNLFDTDPARTGRSLAADTMGPGARPPGKIYLQVSLGALVLDLIHDSHYSVR